jgi:hypothetical protein
MKQVAISLALAFSAAGAAFGAYTVARESVIFERFPDYGIEEFDRIASGQARIALSSYAKRQILSSCHYGLTSRLSLVRPTAEIQRFATACQNYAQGVASTMHTNAFAWLVLATASQAIGDEPAMNEALQISQRTGPNEQWLVERRVAFAERHFDALSEQSRLSHEQDLALLANSFRGVKAIAGRYVADEAFRNRVTAVVSRQPDEIQRRFIHFVREAAKGLSR